MTDFFSTYRIRPAVLSDGDAIAALDQSANPNPWAESHVYDALTTRQNWVVETLLDRQIVGWLTASNVVDQAELELIVTHTNHRRKGLAKRLMSTWLAWCAEQLIAESLLEVRASNESAIALYLGCGFVKVGQRKNYYSVIGGGQEDACLMTRHFSD
ncbi:GNAT family N-acetyltransferase [Marinomonas piezotolerans]|uniref:GNAT family N-acetyltransferase n=1 Tax=Marinomonas piezotolerans TaxID=2213058 RepID=A0A370U8L3_9GAMM|nr:GNAT family N-acetyltransferase [Marinomonas piezotolerans]RDL44083.1 GNAT family N-acetyltransferase [Marinomonas piezotolerans]